MPGEILWSVTASTSIVVFLRCALAFRHGIPGAGGDNVIEQEGGRGRRSEPADRGDEGEFAEARTPSSPGMSRLHGGSDHHARGEPEERVPRLAETVLL